MSGPEFVRHACGERVPAGLLWVHVPTCPATPQLGETGRRYTEDAAVNARDPHVRKIAAQVLRDDDALAVMKSHPLKCVPGNCHCRAQDVDHPACGKSVLPDLGRPCALAEGHVGPCFAVAS